MSTEVIKVTVGNYKVQDKGALRGFFSLVIYPYGQKILNCAYFEKGAQRWFTFPTKMNTKADGEKEYIPVISYLDKEYLERLKKAVLDDIERFLREEPDVQANNRPQNKAPSKSSYDTEELPF